MEYGALLISESDLQKKNSKRIEYRRFLLPLFFVCLYAFNTNYGLCRTSWSLRRTHFLNNHLPNNSAALTITRTRNRLFISSWTCPLFNLSKTNHRQTSCRLYNRHDHSQQIYLFSLLLFPHQIHSNCSRITVRRLPSFGTVQTRTIMTRLQTSIPFMAHSPPPQTRDTPPRLSCPHPRYTTPTTSYDTMLPSHRSTPTRACFEDVKANPLPK